MAIVLEIDAGNSFLKCRARQGDNVVARAYFPSTEAGQLADFIRQQSATEICLSNVSNPATSELVKNTADQLGATYFLARTQSEQAGVKCAYADVSTMGVDRWLAILAAYHQCQGGCVVVDAGSAVTVDLVNSAGAHLGGYIVPGLTMMRNALFQGTQQVRPNDQARASVEPGCSTSDAVNHGLLLMVRGLIYESLRQMSDDTALLITGGDAEAVATVLNDECQRVPDLVLDGLWLSYLDEQSRG